MTTQETLKVKKYKVIVAYLFTLCLVTTPFFGDLGLCPKPHWRDESLQASHHVRLVPRPFLFTA
jgi:hypothetical protein